jgi:hypothetical protein
MSLSSLVYTIIRNKLFTISYQDLILKWSLNFSPRHYVQIGYRVHPGSYFMGTGSSFTWKNGQSVKLTTYTHLKSKLQKHKDLPPRLLYASIKWCLVPGTALSLLHCINGGRAYTYTMCWTRNNDGLQSIVLFSRKCITRIAFMIVKYKLSEWYNIHFYISQFNVFSEMRLCSNVNYRTIRSLTIQQCLTCIL